MVKQFNLTTFHQCMAHLVLLNHVEIVNQFVRPDAHKDQQNPCEQVFMRYEECTIKKIDAQDKETITL